MPNNEYIKKWVFYPTQLLASDNQMFPKLCLKPFGIASFRTLFIGLIKRPLMEMRVLNSHICQRVIFAEAAASAKTVFDLEPKSKASKKIEKLVSEIFDVRMLKNEKENYHQKSES